MPETSEYTRLGDGGNQSLFTRWQYLTGLEKALILISTVFGIVIFSLAVALAKCDAQVTPTPSPNVTTVAPETTIAPNSTTDKPSSTTVPPSSTTDKPNLTTDKPSSTTVPPSSTTDKPSSTTVLPSSTTDKPSSTTDKPSSTTVPPSSTTVPQSSTTIPLSSSTEQLNTESDAPISKNTTKLLENIPPIPVTGIKLISPQTDETIRNKNLAEKEETVTPEVLENYTENSKGISSKHPLLSRQKRIDISATAEGRKDNPIYE